ncbi:hypothetical protein G7046_g1235 [Stylonectria norvegica]|nr:hypothetical protein G7046_g1235 [Stylonectria norvegica]
MASYLVTGASRGLGFEFIRQLSADSKNTVIGLVRNKAEAEEKASKEIGRSNLHFVQASLTDYDSLVKSVGEVSKITGGSIDHIIANAADLGTWSGFDAFGPLGEQPAELERELVDIFKVNVVGNIHLFNLYLPLLSKSQVKKAIVISSGVADNNLTTDLVLPLGGPYAISKAAVNSAVAKFDAEHRKDGILFLAVCPGFVNTGHFDNLTEKQQAAAASVGAAFAKYQPNFTGPATPEDSIRDVLSVIHKSSVAGGQGGQFLSHFGNKQWI